MLYTWYMPQGKMTCQNKLTQILFHLYYPFVRAMPLSEQQQVLFLQLLDRCRTLCFSPPPFFRATAGVFPSNHLDFGILVLLSQWGAGV